MNSRAISGTAILKACMMITLIGALTACAAELVRPIRSETVKSRMKPFVDKGDPGAEFQMGVATCCGPKGAKYDTEKAMGYFCPSAFKGHTGSMVWLGKIYENINREWYNPVPKNDLKAYMWYSVASDRGHPDAPELKRNLEQYMTPKNLARAKEYAAHWQSVRCGPIEEPKGPWDAEWVAEQERAERAMIREERRQDFSKPQIKEEKRNSEYPSLKNR